MDAGKTSQARICGKKASREDAKDGKGRRKVCVGVFFFSFLFVGSCVIDEIGICA